MFLPASVILLTGGCLPQCMLGYTPWSRHPPEQTPPGVDTPQSRHPPRADTLQEQTPLGADPPQEQTCPPSRSRHAPPEQTPPPRSRHPPGKHAGRYGQCAGGTHPTGMQSCFYLLSILKHSAPSGSQTITLAVLR